MKITGYGPWTLTLGSDREHKLQMLQASLYEKIQKLIKDEDLRINFGNAGREFIESNFSWNVITQKFLENVKTVIS